MGSKIARRVAEKKIASAGRNAAWLDGKYHWKTKNPYNPAPDYPIGLPECRRRIIIEDFDFGVIRHEIRLWKTNRIDCYRMEVDDEIISVRMGWARVLEKIRKSFLRVQAI